MYALVWTHPAYGSSNSLWLPAVPNIDLQSWRFNIEIPYSLELGIPEFTLLVATIEHFIGLKLEVDVEVPNLNGISTYTIVVAMAPDYCR